MDIIYRIFGGDSRGRSGCHRRGSKLISNKNICPLNKVFRRILQCAVKYLPGHIKGLNNISSRETKIK
jgi:hypothetical protein